MAERPLLLNHVERVYRPGEVDHAHAYFETLGFGVTQWESWLVVKIDPEKGNGLDNVMYARATPAQQNFDAALEEALATNARLAETLERQQAIRQRWPFYNFHFGASIPPTRSGWSGWSACGRPTAAIRCSRGGSTSPCSTPATRRRVGPQLAGLRPHRHPGLRPVLSGAPLRDPVDAAPEEGELTFSGWRRSPPRTSCPRWRTWSSARSPTAGRRRRRGGWRRPAAPRAPPAAARRARRR